MKSFSYYAGLYMLSVLPLSIVYHALPVAGFAAFVLSIITIGSWIPFEEFGVSSEESLHP